HWTCATPELLRFSLRKPNLKQDNGVAPSRHAEPTHNYVTRAETTSGNLHLLEHIVVHAAVA
ncbi:hypothetical protein ABLE94_12840, partial [Gordonia sp. VNK1]|uniref:hypothetical protein n=1 Tax=Gordonia oleivorans TaxID=3156618 RepID=UPI0032B35739